MATIKHFSDFNGRTVELVGVQPMKNADFAVCFAGIKGRRYDSFTMRVGVIAGSRDLLPVTRVIEFKSNPSLHICSSKCMNAKPNGTCECSCGGKNHGVSGFLCQAA
jgi:predicted hotdog family 3-hydroxylacyl-ACP dehydratase